MGGRRVRRDAARHLEGRHGRAGQTSAVLQVGCMAMACPRLEGGAPHPPPCAAAQRRKSAGSSGGPRQCSSSSVPAATRPTKPPHLDDHEHKGQPQRQHQLALDLRQAGPRSCGRAARSRRSSSRQPFNRRCRRQATRSSGPHPLVRHALLLGRAAGQLADADAARKGGCEWGREGRHVSADGQQPGGSDLAAAAAAAAAPPKLTQAVAEAGAAARAGSRRRHAGHRHGPWGAALKQGRAVLAHARSARLCAAHGCQLLRRRRARCAGRGSGRVSKVRLLCSLKAALNRAPWQLHRAVSQCHAASAATTATGPMCMPVARRAADRRRCGVRAEPCSALVRRQGNSPTGVPCSTVMLQQLGRRVDAHMRSDA